MFETSVDTVLLWAALGAVSVAVLAVLVQVPTTAPPDATAAAATVDEVATSPPGSVGHRPISATHWSLGAGQLGLQNDAGTAHASLLTTVTPARGDALVAVLDGARPRSEFASPRAFARAARRVRTGTTNTTWWPAPDRLTIRRVAWGDVDVTLVG